MLSSISSRKLIRQIGVQARLALRYYGGKWRLVDWITLAPAVTQVQVSRIPPFTPATLSPMAGAASVLFSELPSEIEVYNNLKSDVVNFFRVLRDREEEPLRAIELTRYSREEYRLAHEPSDDLVEPARR